MAAFLQTLKETFADPGEALKLRWIDVDFSNNVVTINQPVKGHRPRQLKVSNKLLAMLNALPKASERIFPTNYSSARAQNNFWQRGLIMSLKKTTSCFSEDPRGSALEQTLQFTSRSHLL